ncbi:MAG: hypothetical protein WA517_14650 [Candidatus Acidiferrum sp.]
MRKSSAKCLANLRLARTMWGKLPKHTIDVLRQLTRKTGVSIAEGDLRLLDGRWYVTHSGLLGIAHRRRCLGIRTAVERELSDPINNRWVCKAIVHRDPFSKGFVGYGDADPTNVSFSVRGSELRIAETRAVNRALRKAYGIGICSLEEVDAPQRAKEMWRELPNQQPAPHASSGSNNGQRLRDKLCFLIRQFRLDPTLVKAYAADFCGAPTLSNASRERIELFISHLEAAAKENRDGLVCKLNSYAQPQEVKS